MSRIWIAKDQRSRFIIMAAQLLRYSTPPTSLSLSLCLLWLINFPCEFGYNEALTRV